LGPKGKYVKHIVNESGAKVQLRGKGSGFLEGPQKAESPEPMHLFISATTQRVLDVAKPLAENLVEHIKQEYTRFQKGQAALPMQQVPPVYYPPGYTTPPYMPYPPYTQYAAPTQAGNSQAYNQSPVYHPPYPPSPPYPPVSIYGAYYPGYNQPTPSNFPPYPEETLPSPKATTSSNTTATKQRRFQEFPLDSSEPSNEPQSNVNEQLESESKSPKTDTLLMPPPPSQGNPNPESHYNEMVVYLNKSFF